MQFAGKYKPYNAINLPSRDWPNAKIQKAPLWCSVDLRDGNQALEIPMGIEQKLEYFKMLVGIGFKQIEVGFPSSSDTEFEFVRTLIEQNLIPDDVAIQVLCPFREPFIKKTIEAVRGAKNVIFHAYTAISPAHRKYNFNKSKEEMFNFIKEGVGLVKKETAALKNTNLTFEFSPECFSQTEPDYSLKICDMVIQEWGKSKNKVIINLPVTVETSMPNQFADLVEYFVKNLRARQDCVISLHNHNDRGEGVADCELGLLAGAERVEGCLFGNGERTGNLDIVNVALNLYSQGIEPNLDFTNIVELSETFTRLTGMEINPRLPYAGELVFTSFSGSHQDAINKAMKKRKDSESWDVPYLIIDPHDIGREYQEIIRINSQSGKGGMAYILEHEFGIVPPKAMLGIIGSQIKAAADRMQKELTPEEVYNIFEEKWLNTKEPLNVLEITEKHIEGERGGSGEEHVAATATIEYFGKRYVITASGNGPLDAFVAVMRRTSAPVFNITSFHEHAIGSGSNTHAMAYVQITFEDGTSKWGVGKSSNVGRAGIAAVVSALNFEE